MFVFYIFVLISIHGLRVEPDEGRSSHNRSALPFQSTGSVWSPTIRREKLAPKLIFQSTGSVWSPTPSGNAVWGAYLFQSTGSVWSPTAAYEPLNNKVDISIHGLRVEPDPMIATSVWSPTQKVSGRKQRSVISIHGLRVEPDVTAQRRCCN